MLAHETSNTAMEPETKRLRSSNPAIEEGKGTQQEDLLLIENDAPDLLGRLKVYKAPASNMGNNNGHMNASVTPMNVYSGFSTDYNAFLPSGVGQMAHQLSLMASQADTWSSDADPKTVIMKLNKEIEKKDEFIQDLIKKLHNATEAVKTQAEQIKELQKKLAAAGIDQGVSVPAQPAPVTYVNEEEFKHFQYLELQIIQQPPSQAVYQRILRPFPTVLITGIRDMKKCNGLFVEVSLVKQDDHNRSNYLPVTPKSNSPLEAEKKNLLGGQLVQRSELGTAPDTLLVVFRKLKILTTTAQQGGAFFLLKFTLKRYIDNTFETIPNVNPIISEPIEVFSHTLYLKNRPNSNNSSPNTARGNSRAALTSSTNSLRSSGGVTAEIMQKLHTSLQLRQSSDEISNNNASNNNGQFSVPDLSSLAAASAAHRLSMSTDSLEDSESNTETNDQ